MRHSFRGLRSVSRLRGIPAALRVRSVTPLLTPVATTAVAIVVAVLGARPVHAQSPVGPTVVVGLRHVEETFTASRPSWREDAFSVWLNASGVSPNRSPAIAVTDTTPQRRRTAVAFDVGRAERFGQGQEFGGIDFYRSLTRSTYMNIRLRAAPRAVVIPELDLAGNVTAGFAPGWEATAGYRLMRYRNNLTYQSISTYSLDAARYIGWWYIRARASLIPVSGSMGTAFVVTARRYLGAADNLVEAVVANGREVVTGAGDEVLDIRQSLSIVGRSEYFVTSSIGIDAGISYTRDSELSRWGVVAGVKKRF